MNYLMMIYFRDTQPMHEVISREQGSAIWINNIDWQQKRLILETPRLSEVLEVLEKPFRAVRIIAMPDDPS